MNFKIIAQDANQTGENPLWHPLEESLYWVDISKGFLYRYDPKIGTPEMVLDNDQMIGGFTFQEDGKLLLFMEKGVVKSWSFGEEPQFFCQCPNEEESRFNDVIADPTGRIFCGTMHFKDQSKGCLYQLDLDGSFSKIEDGVLCSNGMGFTKNLETMYYIDSRKNVVYQYDYNQENSKLSNQKILIDTGDDIPDGMTVDTKDNLWIAFWDGSRVAQYNSQGKEINRIDFPTPKITCITFGGENFDQAFVTSATGGPGINPDKKAGALFQCFTDCQGSPEFLSKILLKS